MTQESVVVLATLIVYQLLLVVIGLATQRLTHDSVDFFLGGRRLGGFVAAISASASSSSAWTLLGVSGAAYAWGLSALWLFPATLGGFLINWWLIAPRLRRLSLATGAVTLTDVVAGGPLGQSRSAAVARLASVILLVSFGFYVAAQFQAAGAAFDSQFGIDPGLAIVIGALIVVFYTLLGGFWAVSVTDSLQGMLMALTAVALPVAGLFAVGGPGPLFAALVQAEGGLYGARAAPAAVGFVLGTLGIGLGYPGQPHVLNRFMALRDDRALAQGRAVAIAWAVLVYAGMLFTGWCARLLLPEADGAGAGEEAFYGLTATLFPPVLAGVMLAAVLSAIMSTADSQLLVAASSLSHDLRRDEAARMSLGRSRAVVLGLSLFALLLALFAPQSIFARVLFAWHAVGSAFGPLVVALLAGRLVPMRVRFAAMLSGALLTVVLHFAPDTPGDVAERLLPLAVSVLLVFAGSRAGGAAAGGARPAAG